MKKQFSLFLIGLFIHVGSNAQDVLFSQYLLTRTYINPGIAGSDKSLNTSQGSHGNFLSNEDGTKYRTSYFSYDQYVRLLRGGIGVDVVADNAGNTLKTNSYTFTYAPHFELFKHHLSIQPGFSFGYTEKEIDWSKLTFGDMIDPSRGFEYNTAEETRLNKKSFFDYSAGLFLYTNNLFGGIAIKHITQPDEGLLGKSTLPYTLIMHSGANLNFKRDTNKNFTFSPKVIYATQSDFNTLRYGISAKLKWFVIGVEGNQDLAIFHIAFQTNYFRLGYSRNENLNPTWNPPSYHEFQLSGFIPYKQKNGKRKTIRFI